MPSQISLSGDHLLLLSLQFSWVEQLADLLQQAGWHVWYWSGQINQPVRSLDTDVQLFPDEFTWQAVVIDNLSQPIDELSLRLARQYVSAQKWWIVSPWAYYDQLQPALSGWQQIWVGDLFGPANLITPYNSAIQALSQQLDWRWGLVWPVAHTDVLQATAQAITQEQAPVWLLPDRPVTWQELNQWCGRKPTAHQTQQWAAIAPQVVQQSRTELDWPEAEQIYQQLRSWLVHQGFVSLPASEPSRQKSRAAATTDWQPAGWLALLGLIRTGWRQLANITQQLVVSLPVMFKRALVASSLSLTAGWLIYWIGWSSTLWPAAQAYWYFGQSQYRLSTQQIQQLNQRLDHWQQSLTHQILLTYLPGVNLVERQLQPALPVLSEMAASLSTTGSLYYQITPLLDNFGAGNLSVSQIQQYAQQASLKVEQLYWNWTRLEAVLNQGQVLSATSFVPQSWQNYWQQSLKLKSQLPWVKQLLNHWPEIWGVEQPKTYAVLFVNNYELRPGGGFIGSFALVKVKHGQLIKWQVYDVYDADGQLKGHVNPPEPIRQYLNEANWYLRDANWDPSLSNTSLAVSWFLDKELNRSIDGLIVVDFHVLEKLWPLLDKRSLVGFDLSAADDSLFTYLQTEIESDFQPGDRTKQTLLSLLFQQVWSQTQNQEISLNQWAKILVESVEGKHIQFFFPLADNKQLMSAGDITQFWDWQFDKQQWLDRVVISEANLGVNKVNYYLKRSWQDKLIINHQGQVRHQLTINYRNPSLADNKLVGDYRAYQRLWLPKGSSLRQISLTQAGQRQVLSWDQIDVDRQEQADVYGYFFVVPKNSQTQLTVDYVLPARLTPGETSYQIKYYKQPGTGDEPLQISLQLPPGSYWQTASGLTLRQGVAYNSNLLTDVTISGVVKFQ